MERRSAYKLSRELAVHAVIAMPLLEAAELLARALVARGPDAGAAVGERRFVTWLSSLSVPGRNPARLYREDARLLWSLQPGASIDGFNFHRDPSTGELQPIRITINERGYRGRAARPEGTPGLRVLCLGDSNFFGYPLDDEDAFPSVLARKLTEREPRAGWEVVNGGVPGYSVVQGWRWFDATFRDLPVGTLLLSFLNNDAWPQPHTDTEVLDARRALLWPLATLAHQSRLLAWIKDAGVHGTRTEVAVRRPRVPLAEFLAGYHRFIEAARAMGARTIILDQRAYPEYAPYSAALAEMARREGVEYLLVTENLPTIEELAQLIERNPAAADRIRRRWGTDTLEARPYLWYQAEIYPEHLNELGVIFLVERVLPTLLKGRNGKS